MWGYGCSSSGGAIMHSTKTNIVSSVRMARLVLLCIVASTCFRYASTQPSGESGDASGSGDDSTSNDDSGSGSDDDEPGIPLSTIPTQGALSTTPTAIAASTSRTVRSFVPSEQVLVIFFDGTLETLTESDQNDLKFQIKREVISRFSGALADDDVQVSLSSGSIIAEVQFANGTSASQIRDLVSSLEATPMTATVGGVTLRSTGVSVRTGPATTVVPSVDDDDDLSDGAIVGIVIAAVVVLAILLYAINFYTKSEQNVQLQDQNTEYMLHFVPNKASNSVSRMGDDGLLYVYTGVTQMSDV